MSETTIDFSSTVSLEIENQSLVTHTAVDPRSGHAALAIGQCLATQTEFEAAAHQALGRRDTAPLANLPGSYTTILDCNEELLIATDLAGQFTLRYQETADHVRLALHGQQLGNTNVDTLYLSGYIVDASGLMDGRTGLEGVRQLEGGQTARFSAGRLAALAEVSLPEDANLGFAEASYALREELASAVERRTRLGKVMTSDFSGGYDSTTLTYLAVRVLSEGIDSFINYNPDLPVGDWHFAQQFASHHPAIRLHARPEDETTLPFVGMMHGIKPGVSPDNWAITNSALRAYLGAIQEHKGQLHMGGEGGDAILSPSLPHVFVDLAHRGDLDQLYSLTQAWGRLKDTDPVKVREKALTDACRTPADDLKKLALQLQDQNSGEPRGESVLLQYPWYYASEEYMTFLRLSARRNLAGLAEELSTTVPDEYNGSLTNFATLRDLRVDSQGKRQMQRYADAHGIELHTPFLDGRVIEAALRLPVHKRVVPNTFKPMLHEGFADILPQALLTRNSKSSYNGRFYRGLRESWDDVAQLLTRDCRLADLQIIEPRSVMEELYKVDAGQGMLRGVLRIIAAEVWLRLLEEGKK